MTSKRLHRCYASIVKGTWREDGLCKKCVKYLQDFMDEQNQQKMSAILDRRHTDKDSDEDILLAINMVAKNRNVRVLNDYENLEWERAKLREIERLSGILVKRRK